MVLPCVSTPAEPPRLRHGSGHAASPGHPNPGGDARAASHDHPQEATRPDGGRRPWSWWMCGEIYGDLPGLVF